VDLGGVLFTLETGFADNNIFVMCLCDVLVISLQEEAQEKNWKLLLTLPNLMKKPE
jgi:hypothetical protein